MKVSGDKIMPGDVMRFRTSKLNPVRWLKVISVVPSGERVAVELENGCTDLVSIRNKSQWRVVRREEVAQ